MSSCTELHTTAIFHFLSDGIISGLMINHTTFATHTATGNVDKNRDCQGTSNASDKGSKDDLLILPIGTRMKLPEMYGINAYRGETVWNKNIIFRNCDMIETENIVFTLKQIRRTFTCEIPVIQSEHPQLFIGIKIQCIYASFLHQQNNNEFTSKHRSHDSKVVYIEILLKNTINLLYNELIKMQCGIERTQLLFKLSLATYSLDGLADLTQNGIDYRVTRYAKVANAKYRHRSDRSVPYHPPPQPTMIRLS
ncbi:Uncharacterized protein FWK35_00035373 [Aphis craccivora]|uniref:Uncharacterized protein n=1 Tax=Aphis craccivora TaxID=307492 RepID=A0A6G0VLT8_APHCR|nr:Uncharacterized protein FWK35_00035373 [Aphis craccivora]